MPLKVYYIDDEKDLCENFSDFFSSPEIQVTTFTEPLKAIEAVKQNLPDVLFIDYRLPGTTGDELAKSIPAEIPKFLITGDIGLKVEYAFIKIFSKPYRPQEIQQVLEGYLNAK
jgi:CheY-like chemotaxis protein